VLSARRSTDQLDPKMLAADIFLVTLFAGVLGCVLCILWLKAACPLDTPAGAAFFASGALPPYSAIRSLRARFVLPWIGLPDLSGCGPTARLAITGSRLAACVAFLSLAALGVLVFDGPRV
jgi:hypothetical protein